MRNHPQFDARHQVTTKLVHSPQAPVHLMVGLISFTNHRSTYLPLGLSFMHRLDTPCIGLKRIFRRLRAGSLDRQTIHGTQIKNTLALRRRCIAAGCTVVPSHVDRFSSRPQLNCRISPPPCTRTLNHHVTNNPWLQHIPGTQTERYTGSPTVADHLRCSITADMNQPYIKCTCFSVAWGA